MGYSRFPVFYAVEPVQNISLARNRSVASAHGEYLAFVDDDEEVSSEWLEQLLLAKRTYDADVVFGPVVYKLPAHAPGWISEGAFYRTAGMPTGKLVTGGATNNALVRAALLTAKDEPFNSSFGLTGSEDYDLFLRLEDEGARLVWCNEAIVWEHVADERLSLNYLVKKAFRSGQQFAVINLPRHGFIQRLSWYMRRCILLSLAMIGMLCTIPLGRRYWGWWMQKASANIGQLSALTRCSRFEHYREHNVVVI
jgi:succinoglycan biosynthesis protein ExoM